jgi:hypothetical protein
LLLPCIGGHKVASVTPVQGDGQYQHTQIDTDMFGATMERQPAVFVRAIASTPGGAKTVLGEGKRLEECSASNSMFFLNVRLPIGLEILRLSLPHSPLVQVRMDSRAATEPFATVPDNDQRFDDFNRAVMAPITAMIAELRRELKNKSC